MREARGLLPSAKIRKKERNMGMIDSILPEFEEEMKSTRKLLERVPEDKRDFRPHEKSMTLWDLAGHLAENAKWTMDILHHDEYVVKPEDTGIFKADSTAHLLEAFDGFVADAKAAMAAADDETLMQVWKLIGPDGKTYVNMPKIVTLRAFVLSHGIHHRGQLTVYLRMLDVALPSIYGPTADEQF
jgi:uncharacterized damage-inducible protein DinB